MARDAVVVASSAVWFASTAEGGAAHASQILCDLVADAFESAAGGVALLACAIGPVAAEIVGSGVPVGRTLA